MEAEIVKIVTGTFSNDESIRTQAEDALGRLDKGKFGINYKNHEIHELFRAKLSNWSAPNWFE